MKSLVRAFKHDKKMRMVFLCKESIKNFDYFKSQKLISLKIGHLKDINANFYFFGEGNAVLLKD